MIVASTLSKIVKVSKAALCKGMKVDAWQNGASAGLDSDASDSPPSASINMNGRLITILEH